MTPREEMLRLARHVRLLAKSDSAKIEIVAQANSAYVDLRAAVAELDIYIDQEWPRIAHAIAALLHTIIAFNNAQLGPTQNAWAHCLTASRGALDREIEQFEGEG